MIGMNICKGCFSELEPDAVRCPLCGWDPKMRYVPGFRWEMGEICDQRYLMGSVYYVNGIKGIAVFRTYDKILKQSGFVLIQRSKKEADYENTAKRLAACELAKNGELLVQTLKKVKEEPALFFSLKDRYMDWQPFDDIFEGIYEEEEKEEFPVVENTQEGVLKSGTVLDGRYRILECLGVGGFGITYLCEEIACNRKVAIKEYYPEQWAVREEEYVDIKQAGLLEAYKFGLQSFLQEIAITALFMHTDHIVTVLDAFEGNNTLYMVMEYIEGISVGRQMRLRNWKPFTEEELKPVLDSVIEAMEEIHKRKLIHSDISPGNIIHATDGRIYLIDLGAAKYVFNKKLTMNAVFLKVDYAAPEQYMTAKEKKPYGEGPWTDIYALGATVFFLLTGEKPKDVIRRLDGDEIDWDILKEQNLSPEKTKLLKMMMELDKDVRIRSVDKLKREIGMIEKAS